MLFHGDGLARGKRHAVELVKRLNDFDLLSLGIALDPDFCEHSAPIF